MDRYPDIPRELKAMRRWVGAFAGSKTPMRLSGEGPASSTLPLTWGDYQEAMRALDKGRCDQVGYVFDGDGIVGIDLDQGFDQEGFLTPLATRIMARCHSYTEISRSGRGLHILVKGKLPFGGRNNLRGVEIYQKGRYFILTGRALIYRELVQNQEAIDWILESQFQDVRRGPGKTSHLPAYYAGCWEAPRDGRVPLRPSYPPIPRGCRNLCLTSLAGALHNLGYPREELFDELMICNRAACKPPLGEGEVAGIAASVSRYRR